jgi:hypothetical protein
MKSIGGDRKAAFKRLRLLVQENFTQKSEAICIGVAQKCRRPSSGMIHGFGEPERPGRRLRDAGRRAGL